MARVLIVTNPFGGRGHGDRITDASEIAAVLVGENASHVIAIDEPTELAGESMPEPFDELTEIPDVTTTEEA